MTVSIYPVGGCVRDELLGRPSKDIDFTVVGTDWVGMREWLNNLGFQIFVETPEFLTMRARFPKTDGVYWVDGSWGLNIAGMTADFVLARKEGTYSDARRPDEVEPGTLEDDLRRRDFTINAMAKIDGTEIFDPFGGLEDLKWRVLRCVGSAEARFREDPLRAIRAIRFAITLGFNPDDEIINALDSAWLPELVKNVDFNRRRDELTKCFKHDTLATLASIGTLSWAMQEALFSDGIWLAPSNKSV